MGDVLGFVLVVVVFVLAVLQRSLRKRMDKLESTQAELRWALDAAQAQVRAAVPVPMQEPVTSTQPPQTVLTEMALAAPFEDGPTEASLAQPADPAVAPVPDAPVKPAEHPAVLTPDLMVRLGGFLRQNWVYVVSALSLALAGIFLVQYGIEAGLLTPPLRVTSALLLGAALVGWGERLRRRGSTVAAYLPATFSGAGIVVIFAAIIAARQLYGLIGQAPTLVGLIATGLIAIALGWYHGVFLICLGLLGAAAAPFLTGGGGEAPTWFYFYYALIAGVGLAVDALRRWAWVSALALTLAFLGGLASQNFGAGGTGWIALLGVLPVLATILPERSLVPRQAGPSFAGARKGALPPFPVRLVAGTLLASSGLIALQALATTETAMLGLVVLCLLVLAFTLWASAAEGLADVAVLPALAFLAVLVLDPMGGAGLASAFGAQATYLRPPETAAPMTVTLIMLMLGAMLGAGGLRALTPGPLALGQAVASVVLAALAAGALEFFWDPSTVQGAFLWALEVIGLAAIAVTLTLAYARRDGDNHHRMGTSALIALALIALALSILTAGTPLTLALSALVVAAAALDRRFDLPEMALFLQVGVAVLTWRIVVDPGVAMATDLPLADFLTGFLGPIAAGIAGLWLVEPRGRATSRAVLESGTLLWIVGFLDAWLLRWLDGGASTWVPEHLSASLMALPWIGAMCTQIYRVARIQTLRKLRLILAGLCAVLGLGLLGIAALPLNPLLTGEAVLGPILLDSLALAYLMPGLILLAAAFRLPGLPDLGRTGGKVLGAALVVLYLGLQIRRFWWGEAFPATLGVKQEELYTYTLALMLIGAGLLAAALARHSAPLRRVAMAVIALTIAKVFLLDAAGLTGLTRVLSFLGLGLSLAGLAWLNSVVERATRAATATTAAPSDPVVPPAAP